MVSPMRTLLRLLICLAISCSLGLASIASQAAVPLAKAGCCAQMEKDAEPKDCGQHSQKNEDKQCCSMCAFCVAVLATKTPFVYPPTGEESFATLSLREHVRSERPPVPPPRASSVGRCLARPATAGRGEGNSTGGFYEIPIDAHRGYRAGWHSKRNVALS